jgi:hypothetical protein
MDSNLNWLLGGGESCKGRSLVGGSDVTGGMSWKGRLMDSKLDGLLEGGGRFKRGGA